MEAGMSTENTGTQKPRYRRSRSEWFGQKKRDKVMAIFAGMETLGWSIHDIAHHLGYKSMSGFHKFISGNGGTTQKKYALILALGEKYLSTDADTVSVPETLKPENISTTGNLSIQPPTPKPATSFETALKKFNTAMALTISASEILKNTAPSNFKSWAHNLNTDIMRIFDTYGSDNSQA